MKRIGELICLGELLSVRNTALVQGGLPSGIILPILYQSLLSWNLAHCQLSAHLYIPSQLPLGNQLSLFVHTKRQLAWPRPYPPFPDRYYAYQNSRVQHISAYYLILRMTFGEVPYSQGLLQEETLALSKADPLPDPMSAADSTMIVGRERVHFH